MIPMVGVAVFAAFSVVCDKPGGWKFEQHAETVAPGIEEEVISLSSPTSAVPPKFKATYSMPIIDMPYALGPSSSHLGVGIDTAINRHQPLFTFYNQNDENRCTFACSEVFRDVNFANGSKFATCTYNGAYTFFAVPEAPRTNYVVRIRTDRRPVFWAKAFREAAEWSKEVSGCRPAAVPAAAFEPLYSTWYQFSQGVTAEKIEKDLKIAARLGMRTMILDDGWQAEKRVGYATCGDWEVAKRFSTDMRAHVRRVQDMGVKYVVWLAPPLLGTKSKAYARFKDKIVCVKWGDTCVLDPRFPEVRQYLAGILVDRMREWGVDGFKLDFIDWFSVRGIEDRAIRENFAGRDIKVMPEAVDALMADIKAKLTAINPDVLIEFRMPYSGPVIMKYGNMIRVGDCPGDYICNRVSTLKLRLAAGGSAVHSDMIEWRKDDTAERAARYVLNSLFSVIQYSMVLGELPADHLKMVRHWVDFTRRHRQALLQGELRPYHPEMGYPVVEGIGEQERVIAVYSENAVAKVEADRRVFVVNATNGRNVMLDFAKAPRKVRAYDTFGEPIAGKDAPGEGLARLDCPPQGYLELEF